MIRLRVKGLPLTRAPQTIEDGWSVFHLNGDKVDWADSCNAARAQIFPGQPLPAVDPVFEAILRARVERAKVAA